jgi:hypothetical protein
LSFKHQNPLGGLDALSEAPRVDRPWMLAQAQGRASNGDDNGGLMSLLRWSGSAGEERAPDKDGRPGRRRGWAAVWHERDSDGPKGG